MSSLSRIFSTSRRTRYSNNLHVFICILVCALGVTVCMVNAKPLPEQSLSEKTCAQSVSNSHIGNSNEYSKAQYWVDISKPIEFISKKLKDLCSFQVVNKAIHSVICDIADKKRKLEAHPYNSKEGISALLQDDELKIFASQKWLNFNQQMWILEHVLLADDEIYQEWMGIIRTKFQLIPEMHHICIRMIRDYAQNEKVSDRAGQFMEFLCSHGKELKRMDCSGFSSIYLMGLLYGQCLGPTAETLVAKYRFVDKEESEKLATLLALTEDLTAVSELIHNEGIDPNVVMNRTSAFIVAARFGYHDIVKSQLNIPDFPVKPKLVGPADHEFTALMSAARHGHMEIFRSLLNVPGINANQGDSMGNTALMSAAKFGNMEIVKSLLNVPGINVNEADSDGYTALMLAAKCGHVEIVESLLNVPGVNVNLADSVGITALMLAAAFGHTKIVESLLNFPGINVNEANSFDYTALALAASNGHMEIVESLLNVPGINYNHVDSFGNSALILAVENGRTQSVRLLLNIPDIKVNQVGSQGNSALLLAVSSAVTYGDTDILRLLLSIPGINVNQADQLGSNTALILAAREGNIEIVRWLLNIPHIDIDHVNAQGNTALMLAAAYGHTVIWELIIAYTGDNML